MKLSFRAIRTELRRASRSMPIAIPNRDMPGDPHRSAGASRHAVHKMHPAAGGGEEFVRIPARAVLFFAFPSSPRPPDGSHARRHIYQPLPAPTTHVFAFQRDVSLNARIAPGLTTLPEGEPVLSGPAARCAETTACCVLYVEKEEEEKGATQESPPCRNSRRIGCNYHSTRSMRFLPVFSR